MNLAKQKKVFLKKLQKDLKQSSLGKDAGQYAEKGAKYSVIFSIVTGFVGIVLLEDIVLALAVCVFSFLFACAFWVYRVALSKKKKALMIEKDIPLFLMALSVQLNVNVPMHKALYNLSKKEENLLEKEIKMAINQCEKAGVSIQAALLGLSERYDSFLLKRSLAQVIAVFEQGEKNSSEPLRSLAREQLALQRTQSKEFSGKLVFYSLLFIAISVIIPSMFQAMVLAGLGFMEIEFSPLQVLAIICLAFPALDIMALYYIRSRTPEFLK